MGNDLRLFAFLAFDRHFLLYIDTEGIFIDGNELTAIFLAFHQHLNVMPEIFLKLHLRLERVCKADASHFKGVVGIGIGVGLYLLHEKAVEVRAKIHIYAGKAVHLYENIVGRGNAQRD